MKFDKKFTVKLGGHKFKVIPVESSEELAERASEYFGFEMEEDPSVHAIIIHAQNIILIRIDIAHSQQEESFLHEIIHGICPDLDEEIVERIAFNLYFVLKDNNLLK